MSNHVLWPYIRWTTGREEVEMSHLLDQAIAAYEGTDGNAAGSLAQSMNI